MAVGDKKVRRDESAALAVKHDDRQVAHLLAARHALAQAQTVREVKRIRDAAAAAEIYATRQQLSDEVIGFAHALKIEALAKLGDLLEKMPKAKGGAKPGVGEERMRFLQGTRWSTGRPGAEHG